MFVSCCPFENDCVSLVFFFFFFFFVCSLLCMGADDAKVAFKIQFDALYKYQKNQYSVFQMKACPKYGNIFDGTKIFTKDKKGA